LYVISTVIYICALWYFVIYIRKFACCSDNYVALTIISEKWARLKYLTDWDVNPIDIKLQLDASNLYDTNDDKYIANTKNPFY